MIAASVWLLVLSSYVYVGEATSVQPQMYPTLQDCEQVGRNLAKARSSTASGDSYTNWRCVQTRVLVPKS